MRGARRLVAALAVLAAAASIRGEAGPGAPAASAAPVPRAVGREVRVPLVLIQPRSDPGASRADVLRAELALERVMATPVGEWARWLLETGAVEGPLTIVLNAHGDNFTPYRVPGEVAGETIVFDPAALPVVETEQGPLPARPETVLAHELGHAVFKLTEEETVIREIENPVRLDLGLPLRSRF